MRNGDGGTILIVEDDPGVAVLQRRRLERAGYAVVHAGTPDEAIQTIQAHPITLVVLDYRLSQDVTGLDFYEQLKANGCTLPVILVTGFSEEAVVVRALRAGVRDFVAKSAEYLEYLAEAVRRVLRQVRTEQQLAESEARLAAIIRSAMDAIITLDQQQRITLFNPAAERLYGWQAADALGRCAVDVLLPKPDAAWEEAQQALAKRGEWFGELVQTTRQGQSFLVQARWNVIRDEQESLRAYLFIHTDITEKKKLEAQYLRAQRMESIGILAGGIAHDLNNVFTPMLMTVDLLSQPLAEDHRQSLLEVLRVSTQRGAALVKQILSFARGAEGKRVPLLLTPIIRETQKLLEHSLPKSIQLEVSCPSDLWLVRGDSTHLSQVLMNLCVNARDAMPQGGILSISAENLVLDSTLAHLPPAARPGPYVLLKVRDTGVGIAPPVLDKIFDPFFTTKEVGQGTGLGLTTALGIVQSYGGFIDVYSQPNQGSVFAVYLPAQVTEATRRTEPESRDAAPGQGEVILLVDDENSIRSMAQVALESNGYQVLTAAHGKEALARHAEQRGRIDLVVLDMMMPILDGPQTLQELRRRDSNLRILATSGLSEGSPSPELLGATAFLPKPYTIRQLLQAVHEMLYGSARQS